MTLYTSYEDCPVDISKEEYLDITGGFMKFIADKIVDGERVTLPSSMGELLVLGRKQVITTGENGEIKGLAPDWKSTLALWDKDPEAKEKKTIIKFFNEHTSGYRYKFGWNTLRVPFRFKSLYTFRATRDNKRRVWKKILEGQEYLRLKSFHSDRIKT